MTSARIPRQVPIAVVGIAAFMPGSTDLGGFWRNVLAGRDLMTDVPASRWLIEDYYDPDPRATDKTYGRRGAFLPEVDFDPVHYGIPPNSLPAIDTSQLLALMVAERVIADCAVGLPEDRERVSVLLGVAPLQLLVESAARLDRPVWLKALREHGLAEAQAQSICDSIAAEFTPWQEETFPGLLSNVVSGRIANKFDLHGANHTTDAACASSLAALYSAVADLSLRRSDLVITGGVDTSNDIPMYRCFTSTPALSPTGDCRPFSAAADGTMLGEGIVMFALKRIADAERDGDHVYAVIRGVGASSDGRGTAIYAPLPAGQVRALQRAYESAGYGPETVELVEAHGTGTSAGDAAEFTALGEVFGAAGRPDRAWCALGSVKSQIGHTKAAAGAAGMLKAVLALQQKVLPPTIKIDRPNPALSLEGSPFYLNTATRPWVRPAAEDAHPRRASVSSFGFGGTNFHVALEEYVPASGSSATPARRLPAAPTELILISGPAPGALLDRARQLDLRRTLTDLARQSQHEFSREDHARLAIVARDADDLAAKLADVAARIETGQLLAPQGQVHYGDGPPTPGLTGFLFPGQGAQYVGMGADLAVHLPLARAAWDRAARHELGDLPLHRVVFPPPAFSDSGAAEADALLTATEWAQPALAVHSVALLTVLTRLGLKPDCVAGHSFGELVALHVAGAFDAEVLIRLARSRGELMRDAAAVPGAMLAVAASRDQAEAFVAGLPDVWLANHNAPAQVVLAGSPQALDSVAARFAAEGMTAVRLKAATGFHSPLVAPAAGPFADVLRQTDIRAPVLDVYAGRDACVYPPDPAEVRRGLAAQITAPVQFVGVVEAMYGRGVRTFVEVGAGVALSGLVGQILGEREHVAVSLDRRRQHGVTSLQEGLAQLAVRGLPIDFGALWAEYAPAEQSPVEVRSKAAVTIDGGNYGRPYPPEGGSAALPPPNAPAAAPAPAPTREPARAPAPSLSGRPAPAIEPALAAPGQPSAEPSGAPGGNGQAPGWLAAAAPAGTPAAPAPAQAPAALGNGDHEWLGVIGSAQEQAAQVQAEFQRAMTESHLAYLRMAEVTFAGLLSAASGEPPSALLPPAPLPPVPLPPVPLPQVPAQAAGVWPAAPTVAEAAAAAGPAASSPPGPVAGAGGRHVSAAPRDADGVGALLLEVVAERTGYPADMLNLDMELDTDLGIDSIKKVEILSTVRERVGDVPGDLAAFATLRTLREIAEQYAELGTPVGEDPASRALPNPAGPAGPAAASAGPAAVPAGPAAAPVAAVLRRAVRAVPAAPSGLALLGLTTGPLAVTDDGTGIAPLVVAQLARHNIHAKVVTHVPPDACGVIALDGLRPVTTVDEALAVERAVFRTAREMAARMDAEGGVFVTVQDTGGDFGLTGYHSGAGATDPVRAWLGGLAALARTAAKEWPRASVKAIDCATAGRPPAAVADAIVAELLTGGATVDAGLRGDGMRITLELAAVPAGQTPPNIGPHSVIVATGGARGVTAAALKLLAKQHRPRLALLGRTPLDCEPDGLPATADRTELIQLLARRQPGTPAEIAAAAHRVLAAREIRETIGAMEQSGARVRYYAVDVTNPAALSETLAEVRSGWGPITGIVHGAGVLADALIAVKTEDQFNRVFDPKVEGLRNLLAATADDPLVVLCAFSSVAAQFGNPGQCDYAMANEVLNQVLSAEQARRTGCLVRALGWGPWQGGMVTSDLADRFGQAGVALIDLDAGAAAFGAELSHPAQEARVIVSAGTSVRPEGALAAQVTVAGPAYAHLADHQVGGVPVVPVATVLDWFAGAARAWRPTANSIALQDLRVLDKISLPRLADGGHRLIVRGREADAVAGPALDLDLLDETGRLHYRARVAAPAPLIPGRWEEAAGLVALASPYDGTTLFHGPGFQAIRSDPVVGPAGAQAAVVGSRALGWEGASGQMDPAAVDGGLQLAVLWARQAGAGRTLPMAIGECRVHRPGAVEAEVRCVVVARRADEFSAACDVALIDPDGSPRVELLGVQLVRRPD